MTTPLKKSGFKQGLYQQSADRKEEVGTLRITQDGRMFRYAKAGGTALAAGKLTVGVAPVANIINQGAPATAIGAYTLTYTAGGAVTYAEDYFKGGMLQVNDAVGEGHQYEIASSSAVTAGTTIYISLKDPIRVALTTASEITLVQSPWMANVISATPESNPTGIPPIAVTANYYYWCQTHGLAIALATGTPAVGTMLIAGGADGSLAAMAATVDIDVPIVARQVGTGVDGEYKPVFLLVE